MKRLNINSIFLILFTGLTCTHLIYTQSVKGFLNNGGTTINDGSNNILGSFGQDATGNITDGTYKLSGGFWANNVFAVTAVQPNTSTNLPVSFNLYQNYPNPFNPSTVIKYELPKSSFVTVKLYNLLGSEIKTLVNGYQQTGVYSITFDGSNLSSGVYLYRIIAGNYSQTKKMILLK